MWKTIIRRTLCHDSAIIRTEFINIHNGEVYAG